VGLSLPSGRVVAVAVCVAGGLALAYLAARHTPLFAVQELHVQGAPPRVEQTIRAELQPVVGTSLVALDGGELVDRLESLPVVKAAAYDRAFPHTLRLVIRPERQLAVVRSRGGGAWVVSEGGRVLRPAPIRALTRLPQIALAPGMLLRPGESLENPATLTALRALTLVPRPFPLHVRSARMQLGHVTLVVGDGTELRLGEPSELGLKLVIAERVLRAVEPEERAQLGYLDLSLPERPAAGRNAQVEG
jgi:cell division protein FtsQ